MKTDKKIMAYLTLNSYTLAKRYAQKNDISFAELIRRALQYYLETKDK